MADDYKNVVSNVRRAAFEFCQRHNVKGVKDCWNPRTNKTTTGHDYLSAVLRVDAGAKDSLVRLSDEDGVFIEPFWGSSGVEWPKFYTIWINQQQSQPSVLW